MNNQNQSPLVPQGSFQEQKNQGRARVKIAVSIVLAIHGIGLLALLMQGCQKEQPPAPAPEQVETSAAPQFEEYTNVPPADTNVAAPPAPAPVIPPEPAPVAAPVPAPTPPVGAQEYAVAAGDSFYSIARKFHVTMKAIQEANPGIEPTRLKIGQKLNIPAPTAPATTGVTAPAPESTGEQTYTVKSGDTLTKIASTHGTTVKALRSANGLKTDSIKVGQKLKIPVKVSAAPAPAAPAPADPTASGTAAPVPGQ